MDTEFLVQMRQSDKCESVIITKFIFWYMSKGEAINLVKNTDLTDKKWNIIKQNFINIYKIDK